MTKQEIVDKLFERTGGFSRKQVSNCATLIAALVSTSFIVNSYGFLFEDLKYDCVTIPNPPDDFECDQEAICKGDDAIISYTTSEDSLENWIVKFNLQCEPDWKKNLIPSAYFFSWAVFSAFLP